MVSDEVVRAGNRLVRGRGASIGVQLTELAKRYSEKKPQELIRALAKVPKSEKVAMGVLVARGVLNEVERTRSPHDLDSFAFRFATHLRISAQDPNCDPEARRVLASAAHYMYDAVNNPPQYDVDTCRNLASRGDQTSRAELWMRYLGCTEAAFRNDAHVIREANPRQKFVRRGRTAEVSPSAEVAAATPIASPAPAWLRHEVARATDGLAAASANWPSGAGKTTDNDLDSAYGAFTRGEYRVAGDALGGLFSSLGRDWEPATTADGRRYWHWLRLVAQLAAIEDGVEDRRRAYASALTLSKLCMPDGDPLVDQLLTETLLGVRGGDDIADRAWAALACRAVFALGHESALSLYDNTQKARLRTLLADIHGQPAFKSASTAEVFSQLHRDFQSSIKKLELARALTPVTKLVAEGGRELMPFLDSGEAELLLSAVELLRETDRAIESASHADLTDLQDELVSKLDAIARSGSLLLQEHLGHHIARAAREAKESLDSIGAKSRPDLNIKLDTTRLPLSARPGTNYTIRVVVNNTGNAPAAGVRVRIESELLQLDSRAVLDRLGVGAEASLDLNAKAIAEPPGTATLTCSASWADSLGQRFESAAEFTVEDQAPASWTDEDVDPFTLNTISDPARLVGRSEDLTKLSALLAGGNSCYVTGHKRVGKTSLVKVLLVNGRRRGWATSVLPLGRALGPDQSAADLVYALIDEIEEVIRDAFPQQSRGLKPFMPDSETNFARASSKWLRGVERILPSDARVIIAVDDFDELPDRLRLGSEADVLFLFLRSLLGEDWLALMFVGSEVLPSIIQGQAHKLNQVTPVSVSNFASRNATSALLETPTSGRLEWDDKAVDRVHFLCRGNPYYETLLGSQIWQSLRSQGRSFVTRPDVDDAANAVSRTMNSSHFVHLWADSSSGIDQASRRSVVTSSVIRAVAMCAGAELHPADRDSVFTMAQTWIASATNGELSQISQSLLGREILEHGSHESQLVMSIPIVSLWLQNAGSRALDAVYADSSHATATTKVITPMDYSEISRGLRYRGEHITEIRIQAWLSQFGDKYHQYLMFQLLRRMTTDGYFPTDRMSARAIPKLAEVALSTPAASNVRREGGYMRNGFLLLHGRAGDSTQGALSVISKALRIKKANILGPVDLVNRVRNVDSAVVFVLDDFSGSGSHLEGELRDLAGLLAEGDDEWPEKIDIVVGAAVVGGDLILDESIPPGTVELVSGLSLGSRFMAFDENAGIFDSEKELVNARDVAESIGRAILPSSPLGFGGQALLVLLEMNCPNNAAPIFWRRGRYGGREWSPLFERAT